MGLFYNKRFIDITDFIQGGIQKERNVDYEHFALENKYSPSTASSRTDEGCVSRKHESVDTID